MKRSPMPRATSPMKRNKPIPWRSAKGRKADAEYRRAKADLSPVCADCGAPATDTHHDRPLGRGGKRSDPANLVPLCRGCHDIRHNTNNLKSGHEPIAPSPLLAWTKGGAA